MVPKCSLISSMVLYYPRCHSQYTPLHDLVVSLQKAHTRVAIKVNVTLQTERNLKIVKTEPHNNNVKLNTGTLKESLYIYF